MIKYTKDITKWFFSRKVCVFIGLAQAFDASIVNNLKTDEIQNQHVLMYSILLLLVFISIFCLIILLLHQLDC